MSDHGSSRALSATLAALVVFSAFQTVTRAADPGEVEDLIRQGVEYRRGGNDNKALPLFKKAYEMAPTPRTAAQLGLVEMALGYRLDAERHLNEGLASPRDIWIGKNRLTLESALQSVRIAIGEIAVLGQPAGAEVRLNGTAVGRLPLKGAVRLGEGPATVEVRAPGYLTESRSILVTGGKRQDVSFNLRRTEVAPTQAPEMVAQPAEVVTPVVEDPPPRSTEDSAADSHQTNSDDDHATLRTLAWVSASVAVVGLGLGIAETFAWRHKQNEFEGVTTPSNANPSVSVLACGAEEPMRGSAPACAGLYDDLKRAERLAIVAYGAAGAFAIGAGVLFLMSRPSERADSQHAIGCAPTGGSKGVACRISF